jgi:hypothetical protein
MSNQNEYSEYYSVWDDSPETKQELNDYYKPSKPDTDEGWDG